MKCLHNVLGCNHNAHHVEQFFDFAFDLADQIVVLKRGEVVANVAKAEVERALILRQVSV